MQSLRRRSACARLCQIYYMHQWLFCQQNINTTAEQDEEVEEEGECPADKSCLAWRRKCLLRKQTGLEVAY